MASVELNGEEQQIPAEEMTEQETAEIQPADVINHTEVEQPIEQVRKVLYKPLHYSSIKNNP